MTDQTKTNQTIKNKLLVIKISAILLLIMLSITINAQITQTLEPISSAPGSTSFNRGWRFTVRQNTTLSQAGMISTNANNCQVFEGTATNLTTEITSSNTIVADIGNFNKIFDIGNIAL